MKNKHRKRIDKLIEETRLNLNHIENQLSKGLVVHMQRVTEMECDVKELDKILWKTQGVKK